MGANSRLAPGSEGGDLRRLALAFARATTAGGQMSPAQYFRVATEVMCRAPCRVLVIGAGHDTELYVRSNAGGRTVVLERHGAWLDLARNAGAEAVGVGYRTSLADGPIDPCPPPEGLPDWVSQETWDVIVIDGPEGFRPEHPGRQQSILLASQLARPGATLFLHDADRPMERLCAARYLKPPDEVLGHRPALAVFRYAEAPHKP